MATRERPLSPHLQVYRPMYTMVLSISHRITGLALSVGRLLLTLWLLALATDAVAYGRFADLVGRPFGRLVLAGFAFAWWFHFCAGIRHLVWDTGRMLEKPAARRSGLAVVVATVVLTVLTVLAMLRFGGAT